MKQAISNGLIRVNRNIVGNLILPEITRKYILYEIRLKINSNQKNIPEHLFTGNAIIVGIAPFGDNATAINRDNIIFKKPENNY